MTRSNETPAPNGRVWRQSRYRWRIYTGLALLGCAAVGLFWIVWGVRTNGLPIFSADSAKPVGLSGCLRLGYRSFLVFIPCAATMLCMLRPMRKARPDFARLAAVEVFIAGVLISAVVLMYWIYWSPMSFMK